MRIRASLTGLAGKIEVTDTSFNDPADRIREQNPLGKVPALIVEDGTVYVRLRA